MVPTMVPAGLRRRYRRLVVQGSAYLQSRAGTCRSSSSAATHQITGGSTYRRCSSHFYRTYLSRLQDVSLASSERISRVFRTYLSRLQNVSLSASERISRVLEMYLFGGCRGRFCNFPTATSHTTHRDFEMQSGLLALPKQVVLVFKEADFDNQSGRLCLPKQVVLVPRVAFYADQGPKGASCKCLSDVYKETY